MVFVLISGLEIWAYSIKPRMTKTIAPHYSGISGRRYTAYRQDESDYLPIIITVGDYTGDYGNYLNYNTSQSAEEIAHEINRRRRVEQLQRSSEKPKGVPQEGEIVGTPLDYKSDFR